jgi:hypothetical protein
VTLSTLQLKEPAEQSAGSFFGASMRFISTAVNIHGCASIADSTKMDDPVVNPVPSVRS